MTGRARTVFGVSPRRLSLALVALLAACPAPAPVCPEGQVQDDDSGECVPEHCGSEAWGLLERTGETIHVAPWGDDGWDGSQEWPYRTIQKGADEAGHMVAVAAGTYLENLELDEDHDGVEIAGRCAELVMIDGSGEEAPGVRARKGESELRGVTVTGGTMGVRVQRDGMGGLVRIELEDVVLAGNTELGLAVVGATASALLVSCEIRETAPTPEGLFGQGIEVLVGAQLEARELLLEGNHDISVYALDPGTIVDLEDAAILDTRALPNGEFGRVIEVGRGAEFSARRLLVDGGREYGLFAYDVGTTVDLDDAEFYDIRPGTFGSGDGLRVQEGAYLEAHGLLVDGAGGDGLVALSEGTFVDLEDTTIRDSRPEQSYLGRGIEVAAGAELEGRGLLLEANHVLGLHVAGAGTRVDLDDATVRGTLAGLAGTRGEGIVVEDGAALDLDGLLVDGNREVGVASRGDGTTLTLAGATIRGTRRVDDGTLGRGMQVGPGGTVSAQGLLLDANHEVGLIALGSGTRVDLVGATIRDTQQRQDGANGEGIIVQDGAQLTAQGLVLLRNHEGGLAATGHGTGVTLVDSEIRDTQPRGDGASGFGVYLAGGASMVGEGLAVEGNSGVGVLAAGEGTSMVLEDVVVRDTQPMKGGILGRGIGVEGGARLEASGLTLDGNRGAGLSASDSGTVVDLEDTLVSGSLGSPNSTSGFGIGVQFGAALIARGLTVHECEGPGLYVVVDATLDAWDVALRRNGFGAAVVLGGALAMHGGEVSGTNPHGSKDGGVGVFAWDVEGSSDLDVQDVSFSDLRGPALYLRGPGRYVMRDCQVKDTGSTPRLPGGVLALEGVEPWHVVADTGEFAGLLLQGNGFDDLPSDAVLLDSSSVTLGVSSETGAPNTFGTLGGVPLLWQRCEGVAPPEVLDGSTPAPACEPVARTLGQALEYDLWVAETEPVE